MIVREGHEEKSSTATTIFWTGIVVGRLSLSIALSHPFLHSPYRNLQLLRILAILATVSITFIISFFIIYI